LWNDARRPRLAAIETRKELTMKTVLVLGANGRFGTAAVHVFAAAGWRVLAQVRRAPASPLPPRAEAVELALADIGALATRAAGARVVVYAVNPLYTRWDEEALPLFRQGLDLAQRLGATFMLPGNVYNFGEGMPARLNEDTPERPSTPKGRQRCAMEAELAARCTQGLNGVVIRAGDFYGSGSGSWFDLAIVKSIAKGRLVYPGPLDVAHAWAYLPDLARAFVAAASLTPEPGLRRFHFAGQKLTGRELLQEIEAAADDLGLRPAAGFKRGGVPWGLMRALGVVVPMWREVARMSYLWRVPHALDGAALERAVGPLPATPLRAALRQSLLDLGLARAAGAPAAA
jgi:nucleoside-diphosphate-sugar epimerase